MKLDQVKILIVGLGQIGGSIGIDLVKNKVADDVLGFDIDETALKEALFRRAITTPVSAPEKAFDQADLIIFASPIRKIIEHIPEYIASAKEGTTFMDVAGTKTEIFETLDKLSAFVNYVSCHPLAGNEKKGIETAEANKFRDSDFIMVPYGETETSSVNLVRSIVQSLDARPLIMSAKEHDKMIALTSHLPYLFSLILTNLAIKQGLENKEVWKLVGGSFKSATRVAVSSPDLTLDMFLTNKYYLSDKIDELIAELTRCKHLINNGNEKDLNLLINEARVKIKEIQSE